MEKNNKWFGILSLCTILTFSHAYGEESQTQLPNPTSDLEKKLSPQELEQIKTEAEKIKDGKQSERSSQATQQAEQADQQPASTEEQPARVIEEKEKRERSIKRYESLRQGFYPSQEISQKPKENLTEGPIRSLDRSQKLR